MSFLRFAAFLSVLSLIALSSAVYVPGDTGAPLRFSVGSFAGGQILDLAATGTVDATGLGGFITYADGSLAQPCTEPLYPYANEGATGYPTTFGGDGVNRLPGGGINFDDNLYRLGYPTEICFAYAGAMTTDTSASGLIRFEALIGTFSPDPSRDDWFLIGRSSRVVVPAGGGDLFVAVNDGSYTNNTGGYTLTVTPVPEPASLAVMAFGVLVAARRRRTRL